MTLSTPTVELPTAWTSQDGRWHITREDWARAKRTLYSDHEHVVRDGVSREVAEYGTPAEIAVAIAEQEVLLRDLRRGSRRACQAAGQAVRQSGESQRAWIARVLQGLSEADDALLGEYQSWFRGAQDVHRNLVALRAGRLSRPWLPELVAPALQRLLDRYEAACEAAVAAALAEVQALPIDDAAWAKELERRARLEQTGGITISRMGTGGQS